MKKSITCPFPIYVWKFIRKRKNYQGGELYVKANTTLLPIRMDTVHITDYYYRSEGKLVTILINNPSKRKGYRVMAHYRKMFYEEMFSRMERDMRYGIEAKAALLDFLAYYDIRENEYKLDRGLKAFQRWQKAQIKTVRA